MKNTLRKTPHGPLTRQDGVKRLVYKHINKSISFLLFFFFSDSALKEAQVLSNTASWTFPYLATAFFFPGSTYQTLLSPSLKYFALIFTRLLNIYFLLRLNWLFFKPHVSIKMYKHFTLVIVPNFYHYLYIIVINSV